MCSCVPGEVLRQCSTANPADIYIRAVHDCTIYIGLIKKNPILY